MKEIHTEIEINSPAEKVWRVLTDFATYPEWNPFEGSGDGDTRDGTVRTSEIRWRRYGVGRGGFSAWFKMSGGIGR
jgi:uncharacterized protein YndB with AHSA1/START domain